MTLLDAPTYDGTRTAKRNKLLVIGLVLCGIVAIVVFVCWNLPAEHTVNQFFAAVEAQDLPRAFGIWNDDPDWQKHRQRYEKTGYPYGRFVLDWGIDSDYGRIVRHKILHSTSYGNNTFLAVEINSRRTAPLTLAVGRSSPAMSFPPFAIKPTQNGFGWIYWQITAVSR